MKKILLVEDNDFIRKMYLMKLGKADDLDVVEAADGPADGERRGGARRGATTNAAGQYTITGLHPGNGYRVEIIDPTAATRVEWFDNQPAVGIEAATVVPSDLPMKSVLLRVVPLGSEWLISPQQPVAKIEIDFGPRDCATLSAMCFG